MARYIKDYQLGENIEEAAKAVTKYLDKKGYKFKTYQYEEVYTKGGALTAPKFVKVTVVKQVLRMEAWGMFSLVGTAVGERYGAKAGSRFCQDLEAIEALLTELGGTCVATDPDAQPAYENPPLVSGKESRKEFRKNHLCPSLVRELRKNTAAAFASVIALAAATIIGAKDVPTILIAIALGAIPCLFAFFMYREKGYGAALGLVVSAGILALFALFAGATAMVIGLRASAFSTKLVSVLTFLVLCLFCGLVGMVAAGTYLLFRKIHRFYRYFVKGKR